MMNKKKNSMRSKLKELRDLEKKKVSEKQDKKDYDYFDVQSEGKKFEIFQKSVFKISEKKFISKVSSLGDVSYAYGKSSVKISYTSSCGTGLSELILFKLVEGGIDVFETSNMMFGDAIESLSFSEVYKNNHLIDSLIFSFLCEMITSSKL